MSGTLDTLGRLAVAQAIYKLVAPAVKTSTPGNLRASLDDSLREMYETAGVRSVDLRVGGVKVGSASARVKGGWEVEDPDAFDAWRRERGFLRDERRVDFSMLTDEQARAVEEFAACLAPQAVSYGPVEDGDWQASTARCGDAAVDADGCMVPGVRWREGVAYTSLRVDPAKVAEALRSMPGVTLAEVLCDPAAFAALAGGGADG